ncbi:MAG: hypothetical protein OIN66_13315 [Candidatus Methanoperedens sp.]|nr:hypothetical protein [Candidatus Methanoperedens sp.]
MMRISVKNRPEAALVFIIFISIIIILISGCLNNSATETQEDQGSQISAKAETAQKKAIEKVSDELSVLNSKDWAKLAVQIGRPRATALLWYHLKTTYNVDTKVVFGNPKKLDAAVAIMESTGGTSPFPTTSIKGVKYYIIDPTVPAIIGEFKYGDLFDDPGNTYLSYSYFRLFPEDIEIVKQWMKESGVNIQYTDFPAK